MPSGSSKDDFAAMLDASFAEAGPSRKRARQGERVEGPVVQIGKDTVFIDIGSRSEASIERYQLEDANGELKVKVGDRVRAVVIEGGDRPKLALRIGKGSGADVAQLEAAQAAGTPVEGTVSKTVKGGLEVEISGRRAFCPVSQIDTQYTADPSIYEGQTLNFKIIEVRDGGRSIVVSRRALLEDERAAVAEETIKSLEAGAVVEGRVTSVKNYGAFVDIGGLEGLVHISELSHARVSSVGDVVQPGETVQVKVLEIDRSDSTPKLRLSMKALTQAPKGGGGKTQRIVEATVVKVEPYGVIVEFGGDEEGEQKQQGVVPNRELDLPPGGTPSRVYPVGSQTRVVSIGTDQNGRPRFSIKRVEEAEARQNFREFAKASKAAEKAAGGLGSLGDILAAKLKG